MTTLQTGAELDSAGPAQDSATGMQLHLSSGQEMNSAFWPDAGVGSRRSCSGGNVGFSNWQYHSSTHTPSLLHSALLSQLDPQWSEVNRSESMWVDPPRRFTVAPPDFFTLAVIAVIIFGTQIWRLGPGVWVPRVYLSGSVHCTSWFQLDGVCNR